MNNNDLFQKFVSDSRLGTIIEQWKKANDIFHIISPTENQHSEILKWLFNPREGHGQGDAILKDFLTAAYWASVQNVYSNKSFFEHWTPSRIASTGFHSVFLIREYRLGDGKRLDLLMVDVENEVLVVVENKHGANFGETQLDEYYSAVATELRQRPVFSKFKTAYIALDKNHSAGDDGDRSKELSNRWAYVDYSWLEPGARRAEMQLRRGNQSASLVTAYCQRQTDYVPPEEQSVTDTLSILVREYKPIIDEFIKLRKRGLSELTPSELRGDMWIYVNHHSEIIDKMIRIKSLAFLESGLRAANPGLRIQSEYGKNYVNFHAATWEPLIGETNLWPLFLKVKRAERAGAAKETFEVSVLYCPSCAHPGSSQPLRAALEKYFPELGKGKQNAMYRTLGRLKSVDETSIHGKLQNLFKQANVVVEEVLAGRL